MGDFRELEGWRGEVEVACWAGWGWGGLVRCSSVIISSVSGRLIFDWPCQATLRKQSKGNSQQTPVILYGLAGSERSFNMGGCVCPLATEALRTDAVPA